MDTYSMHTGQTVTGVVTGKPLDLGGSLGRREATGRGVSVMCDSALRHLGMSREGCRVIVQGFGNVGGFTARYLAEKGYKVVGVAEMHHGVYNPNGLNIPALLRHRAETGSIAGFREAEAADPAALLTTKCDILVPAATENVITSKNAAHIKARILCEGANGPTTPAADEILAANNVFVVPDILANSGGVTTSYFEWVQDRMGYFWEEEVVFQRLDRIMRESFDAVLAYAVNHGVNNRIAAYMLAIDRVAFTLRQRGIYA
jgi:glutamate dehydrogenase (NAD(P)+)